MADTARRRRSQKRSGQAAASAAQDATVFGFERAQSGKKESRAYVYDAANRLVEGTNWQGDKSAYTYNGLGVRVNNTVTTHAGKSYERDYVIDYTSPENDDLYVYALGNGQLEDEQKHVYAASERLEQITEKGSGGWERTLYVHEDVMGNTRYYTKANGQSFAELQYDAWGQPVSPNKLVNNDHGNYVFATFTGHIYDTTLDIYFAEARFYDASTRTWMAMDPIKSGLNWYSYVAANPVTFVDWTGRMEMHIVEAGEDGTEPYISVSPEPYEEYAGLTIIDSLILYGGVSLFATGYYIYNEDTERSTLYTPTSMWDHVSGEGIPLLDYTVSAVEQIQASTPAGVSASVSALSKGLTEAGWLLTVTGLSKNQRVQDDQSMLAMMESAGLVTQIDESHYRYNVELPGDPEGQREALDDLFELVDASYAFFETDAGDFFHTHRPANGAFSMKSDYEIYLELKNLPQQQREQQLQEYVRSYRGKVLSAFYTENRSPELTAEQSRTLYQLTLQYEQRLRNLDVQYKEVFYEFEQLLCELQ